MVMKDREECVDLPYLYLLIILNDSRVIRRIEHIVQGAASTPLAGGEAESHARNTLHALKLPLGEDRSADGRFITLMSEICTLSFLSSQILCRTLIDILSSPLIYNTDFLTPSRERV